MMILIGIFFLLSAGVLLFWNWIKSLIPSDPLIRVQFFGLALYHLIFIGIYQVYMSQEGGDAVRYWTVTADLSQYAQTWMDYFGFSTFFIQWLNYVPSKLFGIPFWMGNLIYGTLSFFGMGIGLLITRTYFLKNECKDWKDIVPFLIWWFPGLHFWTAGVGKEGLIFLGLILIWWSLLQTKQQVLTLILGIGLVILTRPFWGVLISLPILVLIWFKLKINPFLKLGFLILILVLVCYGGGWIWERSHLEEFSFQAIEKFSSNQLSFLATFKANSAIPMHEMNFLERLFAVAFRPMIWEVQGFKSLIYSLENLVFLLFFLAVGWALITKRIRIRLDILMILGFLSLIYLSFSLTLNNYGVFYRMKSVWYPFLYITLLWLIWPVLSKPKD